MTTARRASSAEQDVRDELVTGRRITMAQMIEQMTWELSGKDVCRAVCGALRTRDFAEADPPIATENA